MTADAATKLDIVGLVIDRATGGQACANLRLTERGLAVMRPTLDPDGADPIARAELAPEAVAAIRAALARAIGE